MCSCFLLGALGLVDLIVIALLSLTDTHRQQMCDEGSLDLSMRNALPSVGLNFDFFMVSRAGRSQKLLLCCSDVTP